MTPITPFERRLALVAVAGSVAVFLALLLVVPPFYQTFDEAKYLGIGYNVVTGNGPRTLFGAIFLPHSPLWPAIFVGPSVWFGVDPFDWGHLLNAVAGVGVVLLTAAFGWRVRPAVGGLAAAGWLAVPYLHDLTRTARLDVPAATLALLYVWVGLAAVRRGSFVMGLVAGAMFAAAFLVKEIALPFAPVPFLAGLVIGLPWQGLARVASGTVLAAALGTSWWFVYFASVTDEVYRLGTPAWTLGPLALVGTAVVVALATAPVIARRRSWSEDLGARRARLTGWFLAVLWFVALAVFFERNPELKGNGLFQPRQWTTYLEAWLPELRGAVLFGIAGVALSVAGWAAGAVVRSGTAFLVLATLCAAPLVLLVVAVGEPPRNYLAQIGLLIALGAAGWFWAAEVSSVRVVPRLARLPRADRSLPVPLLVFGFLVVFVGSSAFLVRHAFAYRESATGVARASLVEATTGWLLDNVPAGAPIGFGNFLGHEMAIGLRGRNPMVQTGQQLFVFDPSAPLGLAAFGQPPVTDFIAIDVASRRALEFYAYRASTFSRIHAGRRTAYYVHNTGTTTSVPSLLGALTPEHGFTRVAGFEFPVVTRSGVAGSVESSVFAVKVGGISFEGSPVFVTVDALARLVELLEADGGGEPAARGLLDRAEIVGEGAGEPEVEALMARLRAIAGP